MPNRYLSARLASQGGTRQVETVIKADAVADAVDLAIARLWTRLWLSLKSANVASAYQTAAAIARDIPMVAASSLASSLGRVALWTHREAAEALSELPLEYLRAAATAPLTEADDPPGIVALTFGKGLKALDLAAKLREPAVRMSKQQRKDAMAKLLFPTPSRQDIDRIVFGTTSGATWEQRLGSATRLAGAQDLAQRIAAGFAAGKDHKQIAKEVLPIVNNVRSSARRIARTESMRMAHQIQMEQNEALGDMVVGYQIHATLDQNTRPEHAARNGKIYYKTPKPGQLSVDEMPHPPQEADSSMAWNCRCYLTPVLTPLEHVEKSPELSAVFETNAGKVVPDPKVYSEWFAKADEKRRRLAVGSRRYDAAETRLGRKPSWIDFIEPATGELLTIDTLKREKEKSRLERVRKLTQIIAERGELIRKLSTFGFLSEAANLT